jgi:hypothetical protein
MVIASALLKCAVGKDSGRKALAACRKRAGDNTMKTPISRQALRSMRSEVRFHARALAQEEKRLAKLEKRLARLEAENLSKPTKSGRPRLALVRLRGAVPNERKVVAQWREDVRQAEFKLACVSAGWWPQDEPLSTWLERNPRPAEAR